MLTKMRKILLSLTVISIVGWVFIMSYYIPNGLTISLGMLAGCGLITFINYQFVEYKNKEVNKYKKQVDIKYKKLQDWHTSLEDKSQVLNEVTTANYLFMNEVERSYKKSGVDINEFPNFKSLKEALEFAYLNTITIKDLE